MPGFHTYLNSVEQSAPAICIAVTPASVGCSLQHCLCCDACMRHVWKAQASSMHSNTPLRPNGPFCCEVPGFGLTLGVSASMRRSHDQREITSGRYLGEHLTRNTADAGSGDSRELERRLCDL